MPTASDILGVPVPSDSPAFLLALGAHVAAGITCVAAGATAALARKRPGLHPRAGLVYVAGLTWIFVSSVVMAVLRWPHDLHLLVIGVLAFATGTFGLVMRVRGRARWQQRHLVAMGFSYILLLTGFYVDNGPHLPGWRHLPAWTFWALPAAIGIPLIARALYRRS
jgi:hypothetical protein